MNAVLKIIMFSIMLNFASGMLLHILPLYNDYPQYTAGLSYNPNQSVNFITGLNGSVNPSGQLQDSGNQIYRVLDFLKIGFIGRVIDTFNQYIFGFTEILRNAFSVYIDKPTSDFIFGTLNTIIAIGYVLAGIYLWTDRRLLQ